MTYVMGYYYIAPLGLGTKSPSIELTFLKFASRNRISLDKTLV
ncbi:MAG: hypothetical protein QOJ02_2245 [Acidobacteriota bacterium]|jgi:hypothetical protein|nr:hypothetical protein [Acidobacteriota bacterium]